MEDIFNMEQEIIEYYKKRNLKIPNVWEALAWVHTEMAEIYELILAREGGWVRNNPDSHAPFDKEKLAEEIGDTIFMLMVAAIVEGVDPVKAMKEKMSRKLKEIK